MKLGLIPIMLTVVLVSSCDNKTSTDPDNTELDPLSSWVYRDSTYTFVSGLAERRHSFDGDPVAGITIWLSDQDITCSDSPIGWSIGGNGASVSVSFPEINTRSYGSLEIAGSMSARSGSSSSAFSGNLGEAGLTLVDTVDQKQVRGWIKFEENDFFEDGEVIRAYGTFDVPYCPESQ